MRTPFIVTGIMRSGTSLFASMVSELPNVMCFNETHYSMHDLYEFFATMHDKIYHGQPIKNKWADSSGDKVATNTLNGKGGQIAIDRKLQKPMHPDLMLLGQKTTKQFLYWLPDLIDKDYPIFAMIRHPVFTLASWRSEKCKRTYMYPLTLEQQAKEWQELARIIWTHKKYITIIKYEDFVTNPMYWIRRFCLRNRLSITNGPPFDFPENMNEMERYPKAKMGEIAAMLEEHAPIVKKFGYDVWKF